MKNLIIIINFNINETKFNKRNKKVLISSLRLSISHDKNK